MKKLLTVILFLTFGCMSAQNEIDLFIETVLADSKAIYVSDPKDKEIQKIFNDIYLETLQNENGEISEDLINKINIAIENSKVKNLHILSLFLVFQDYMLELSENDEVYNPEFQYKIITTMENEFIKLNQEIPTLVYIYKIESLQANEKFEDADALTNLAYNKHPDSVVLKVFQYLATNNESLKQEIISKHKNHWFVKEMEI